jgi:hypothetical protein
MTACLYILSILSFIMKFAFSVSCIIYAVVNVPLKQEENIMPPLTPVQYQKLLFPVQVCAFGVMSFIPYQFFYSVMCMQK